MSSTHSSPSRARSEPVSASEELDRLLRQRQADRLPSVAAAVVRKGETVWSNAVGVADYDDDRAATPQTQYRVGSITKTFTAVAIMQLYAAGELVGGIFWFNYPGGSGLTNGAVFGKIAGASAAARI